MVLDASAAVELLLRTSAGDRVAMRIARPTETIHAPHLLDVEVAQVLRRQEALGEVEPDRAREALGDLGDLNLTRYGHGLLLSRVWALRRNVSAYDAAYVALAEVLDAPLVTCDRRLAKAPGHHARVEMV